MAPAWIREAMERFPGVRIFQGYGLTEAAPILTILDHETHIRGLKGGEEHLLTSAGKPVADVWIRIVGRDGEDLAAGEVGEVVVKGPNVMAGYLNMPQETAAALTDGWLATGDIGRFDEEGFLLSPRPQEGHGRDRRRERLHHRSRGGALSPPRRDGGGGDRRPPTTSMGEALLRRRRAARGRRACRRRDPDRALAGTHIGGYKIPRRYAFVAEMPKNAMGKILKAELRKIQGAGNEKPKP